MLRAYRSSAEDLDVMAPVEDVPGRGGQSTDAGRKLATVDLPIRQIVANVEGLYESYSRSQSPGLPRKYAELHDEVAVDYGRFSLQRIDGQSVGAANDTDPQQRLMTVVPGAGIMFASLALDHFPHVTVELCRLVDDGAYHVQTGVDGRQRALEDGILFARGTERWTIRIWPEQRDNPPTTAEHRT